MGRLMHRFLVFVIAVCTVAFAVPAVRAQSTDTRVIAAEKAGEMIIGSLANMTIANQLCAVGDPEALKRAVAAIDRRFRFCVARDAAWSQLLGDFEAEEKQALVEGSARSIGSFVLDEFAKVRETEVRLEGAASYCAQLPWKMLLEPAAATPEARAEYMRAHPTATLDRGLAFFHFILGLGRDPAWIEASCDKDFWPPLPGSDKQ